MSWKFGPTLPCLIVLSFVSEMPRASLVWSGVIRGDVGGVQIAVVIWVGPW